MTLAVVRSRALQGLVARPVHVEVHLANGLPGFALVGLADTEVKESRERVRAALAESGFPFPHNRRVTVSLAPADLPKESGRFDLPIALGILAASGVVDASRLARLECAGELSLAGELRPVRGALALALAVRREAPGVTLLLPAGSAELAANVPGVEVRAATNLRQVVQALLPEPVAPLPRAQAAAPGAPPAPQPDLREVRGQFAARRALEIAAAGAHSLLLVGPPGAGKSMLAQRLVSILPALELEEALESAAVQGLGASGLAGTEGGFGTQRPLRAPHHSASAAALVGGGSPPRPGEISLAHGGVLFLDELPEFPRAALEALREPLETGEITLSRAARQARYPARFQFVAAMNPCPCGWLGAPAGSRRCCRCTPDAVSRYQGRLSGPLLDRLDLVVEVPLASPETLLAGEPGEPSAAVRERVVAARERMAQRQGGPNGTLAPESAGRLPALDAATQRHLAAVATRLGWSARAVSRVQRLAQTIADLAGLERPGLDQVREAIQCRRGLPGAGAS